ncbi:MAG: hypothetical protein ABH803_02200 [Candidatus Micrarchaeota archaeon]
MRGQGAFEYVLILGAVMLVLAVFFVTLQGGFGGVSSQLQENQQLLFKPRLLGPLFEDDFTQGITKWEVLTGSWKAENEAVVGSSPGSGGNMLPGLIVKDSSWSASSDYSFTAKMKISSGNPSAPFFIVRFQDAANFYGIEFYSGLIIFRPKINGVDKSWVYSVTHPDSQFPRKNQDYLISVVVAGNNLKVLVDNALVFDYEVPEQYRVSSGGFGFTNHAGSNIKVVFDDVVVEKASPPAPTPIPPVLSLPFSDSFVSDSNWIKVAGTWFIENGEYAGTNPVGTNSLGTFVKGSDWTDYSFSFKIKSIEGSTRAIGPVVRVKDENNYWWLEFYSGMIIFRPKINGVDGAWVKTVEVKKNFPQKNKYYDVKVDVKGSSLKVFIDGKLEMDYVVPSKYDLVSGGVGFTQHIGSVNEKFVVDDVDVR